MSSVSRASPGRTLRNWCAPVARRFPLCCRRTAPRNSMHSCLRGAKLTRISSRRLQPSRASSWLARQRRRSAHTCTLSSTSRWTIGSARVREPCIGTLRRGITRPTPGQNDILPGCTPGDGSMVSHTWYLSTIGTHGSMTTTRFCKRPSRTYSHGAEPALSGTVWRGGAKVSRVY